MSKGKQEPKKHFNADKYREIVNALGITDREICHRITKLHIVISKDPLYPDDPDKDRIVTCTPENLTRAKKSGYISPSILTAIGKVLEVAPEYLSEETAVFDDFGITPKYKFHEYQNFINLSPEEKGIYRQNFLFDLGIYDAWMEMDNRERANCHTAIREFSNWLLDYVKPSEADYNDLFEFFSKTGLHMQATPELRQELFRTLALTYKVFMETHKK